MGYVPESPLVEEPLHSYVSPYFFITSAMYSCYSKRHFSFISICCKALEWAFYMKESVAFKRNALTFLSIYFSKSGSICVVIKCNGSQYFLMKTVHIIGQRFWFSLFNESKLGRCPRGLTLYAWYPSYGVLGGCGAVIPRAYGLKLGVHTWWFFLWSTSFGTSGSGMSCFSSCCGGVS